MIRLRWHFWLLVLLVASGCAQHLCELKSTQTLRLPIKQPEEVTTAQWLMLLTRGPSHTCLGETMIPPSVKSQHLTPLAAPTHQFFASQNRDGRHVVWLQTHASPLGVGGPVAWVQQTGTGFKALAIGFFEGPQKAFKMNVSWSPVGLALWAHKSGCSWHKPLGQKLCFDTLQVLPVVGTAMGAQDRAATLHLLREEALMLPGSWYRITRQRTQYHFDGCHLLLQESAQKQDVFARSAHIPPRNRRKAFKRRTLTLSDSGVWTASEPSLWESF